MSALAAGRMPKALSARESPRPRAQIAAHCNRDGGRAITAAAPIIALIAIALAACATEAIEGTKQVKGLVLSAYAAHEECAKLAPGDRLEYRFAADAPVKFNVHYHDGAAVVEPIGRDGVTDDAGIFSPVIAQDYCLMWEAGTAPASLDYRIGIRRASR